MPRVPYSDGAYWIASQDSFWPHPDSESMHEMLAHARSVKDARQRDELTIPPLNMLEPDEPNLPEPDGRLWIMRHDGEMAPLDEAQPPQEWLTVTRMHPERA